MGYKNKKKENGLQKLRLQRRLQKLKLRPLLH